MTSEHLSRDPDQVTTPLTVRQHLMRALTAPPDWRIWIGRFQRKDWAGQWVRVTFPILDSENFPSGEVILDRRPNSQTTAFTVGKLFVFAMACPFPRITHGWDWRTAPRARVCLQQIWPILSNPITWPLLDLTDDDASGISTAFRRYSDDLAKRVGHR